MRKDRIAILREMEASCYGVCLHMLEDEKSAAFAAQETLKHLYFDEEFWLLSTADQERKIGRLAAARALGWRRCH